MIAQAKSAGTEVMEASVRIAKAHQPILWIGAMAECTLALGVYEVMKAVIFDVSAGLVLAKSLHAAELLLVAIISTWYWTFTTLLMRQATRKGDDLMIEQRAS